MLWVSAALGNLHERGQQFLGFDGFLFLIVTVTVVTFGLIFSIYTIVIMRDMFWLNWIKIDLKEQCAELRYFKVDDIDICRECVKGRVRYIVREQKTGIEIFTIKDPSMRERLRKYYSRNRWVHKLSKKLLG